MRTAAVSNCDLIVIGAGPGGYVCAVRAAQLGLRVCLIDSRAALGGTCLNVGCIPSKALLESSHLYYTAQHDFAAHGLVCSQLKLDLARLQQRKERVVQKLIRGIAHLMQKNNINVVHGQAKFIAPHKLQVGKQTLAAPHIVIATGSSPIAIDSAPYDGKHIVSSTEALAFTRVPASLAVIGGGVIGLEMASIWSRLGSVVTIIEAQPQVLGAMDSDCAATIATIMRQQGVHFHLNTTLTAATVHKDSVTLTYGEQQQDFDKVLVAVGRQAYTAELGLADVGVRCNARGTIVVDGQWRTAVEGIYAIGDVIGGAMLAHKAEEEGVAVAENIAGQAGHVNYDAVPTVVYTFPEVAGLGMTAAQAQAQGVQVKESKFPFSANGRALAAGHSEGFVKIVAATSSDEMLGAHIVGAQASELIAELALAREYRASSEDVARTVHAHPTLAEASKEAALGIAGRAVHL